MTRKTCTSSKKPSRVHIEVVLADNSNPHLYFNNICLLHSIVGVVVGEDSEEGMNTREKGAHTKKKRGQTGKREQG